MLQEQVVCANLKKDSKLVPANYRPILLTSHLYTRYPIVARALGRVRARAKESCIQTSHCDQDI